MDAAPSWTNAGAADGEVVWSWRRKAGAELRGMTRGNGDNNVWFTGESTKDTVKTIAQGRPDVRLVPVVTPPAFCLQAEHPAFPAPSPFRGRCFQRLGRGNAWRDYTCVAWLFDIQIKALRRGSRGRRSHGRHCERSEAIQNASAATDCFIAHAPRNDANMHTSSRFPSRTTRGNPAPLVRRDDR
jgi:hypothetical protein